MLPDIAAAALRSLGFIAIFQAAGIAIFLALFGALLDASLAPIERLARRSALAAALLLGGQYLLEAARMADDMTRVLDLSLQRLVLDSAVSVVLALRLVGLAVVAAAMGSRGAVTRWLGVFGAVMVAVSFALLGHTAVHPLRWILAPLLVIHVLIVGFWFGALAPLYRVSLLEPSRTAAAITERFSIAAVRVVPGIFVAGLALGLVLVRQFAVLGQPYGRLLVAKFAGFVVLMALAALNKWRLAPAIASGAPTALRALRRSLGAEYGLICAVLSATAVMTLLYSPDT